MLNNLRAVMLNLKPVTFYKQMKYFQYKAVNMTYNPYTLCKNKNFVNIFQGSYFNFDIQIFKIKIHSSN